MNGKACKECPYTVKAPRTAEARAALDVLLSGAAWARAGLSAIETGLDLTAAMARIPGDVDAHAVRRLLLDAEPRVLDAIALRREDLETHGKT